MREKEMECKKEKSKNRMAWETGQSAAIHCYSDLFCSVSEVLKSRLTLAHEQLQARLSVRPLRGRARRSARRRRGSGPWAARSQRSPRPCL